MVTPHVHLGRNCRGTAHCAAVLTPCLNVQAINKEKLYSTEDGEPKQVDDPEEAIGESQLRHALMFDEYAIAKVLSLCEFTPHVIPPSSPSLRTWTPCNQVDLGCQLLKMFLV
jgi:hypothetical protein